MGKKQLSAEEDFIVGESKGMKIFLGIACLVVFALSFFAGGEASTDKLSLPVLFLIPAVYFLLSLRKNDPIIRINRTGFYYHKELITRWSEFKSANVVEEPRLASISDNFVLILEFYVPGKAGLSTKKIPMKNTHDKAEEEIIAAIKFFLNNSKIAAGNS